MVELGLSLVVLSPESCNKSFFVKIVEVSSVVLLVLCLVIGGYS